MSHDDREEDRNEGDGAPVAEAGARQAREPEQGSPGGGDEPVRAGAGNGTTVRTESQPEIDADKPVLCGNLRLEVRFECGACGHTHITAPSQKMLGVVAGALQAQMKCSKCKAKLVVAAPEKPLIQVPGVSIKQMQRRENARQNGRLAGPTGKLIT